MRLRVGSVFALACWFFCLPDCYFLFLNLEWIEADYVVGRELTVEYVILQGPVKCKFGYELFESFGLDEGCAGFTGEE